MNTIKNSIELNGRTYNAITGEAITSGQKSIITKPSDPAVHKPPPSGLILDGVKRRSKPPTTGRGSHHIQPVVDKPAVEKPHSLQRVHTPSRRKPERSKTLMRATVKKPTATAAVHTGSTPAAGHRPLANKVNKHSATHSGTASHYQLSTGRLNRAQAISKSTRISKFSTEAISLKKRTEALPVRAAPPKLDISRAHSASTQAVSRPDYGSNLLNHALEQADSHQQAAHRRPRLHHRTARKLGLSSRAGTFAAGALVVVLLSGFFAYQNLPNLKMRLAARQAGFAATLPDYRPSGFVMSGPIEHSPGRVVINFQSNSDDRAYTVAQSPSGLNSGSLLETFLTTNDRAYQTLYDKGKTIYVYDNSDATWVSGGILYEIEGDSSLSKDQLLRIAHSL